MTAVLVVEDEANIRKFVVANLRIRGYEVLEARDAEQGLRLLEGRLPGAVVLDVKLPGMDGWAFLAALTTNPALASIPVILMTAHVLDPDARKRRYPNITEVIYKPVSAGQLMGAVHRALADAAA